MSENKTFTQGKILSPLIRFALPVLFAMFLQTMYGAVDLLVVGRFSSPSGVSAVSTGSWMMHAVTAGITGLAMGTTVLLGMRIGEGKRHEAGRVIGGSIAFFAVLSAVLTVLMYIFAPQLSSLLRAPAEAFSQTVAYIRICSLGSVFIVAYNLIGSIFRGMGNSKLPLYSVIVACVLNILGDLFLVGVLDMGSSGAAAATVISQAVSVAASFFLIRNQGLPFDFSKSDIKFDRPVIKQVVHIGFPIALQDVLVSISFLAITAIVNSMGVTISAGVGIAEKLCGFIMLVPSAFGQSMSAFVAQNIGARRPDRARKALFYAVSVSFMVGVLMFYISFFHGDIMSGLFSGDAEVISYSAQYLKSYAIDCLFTCFLFCFTGYFNGCGKTRFVMVQGIIGAFGVRIPVSFLMSRLTPVSVFRVGLATPASTVVQIILCGAYFYMMMRKDKSALHSRQTADIH